MFQNDARHEGDHPRPWIKKVNRSGITLRDADGATVLLIPFTGLSSRNRKARAADLILRSVNAENKDEPRPGRAENWRQGGENASPPRFAAGLRVR